MIHVIKQKWCYDYGKVKLLFIPLIKYFSILKKECINKGGGVISDSQPGFDLKYYDIPCKHSNHWYT